MIYSHAPNVHSEYQPVADDIESHVEHIEDCQALGVYHQKVFILYNYEIYMIWFSFFSLLLFPFLFLLVYRISKLLYGICGTRDSGLCMCMLVRCFYFKLNRQWNGRRDLINVHTNIAIQCLIARYSAKRSTNSELCEFICCDRLYKYIVYQAHHVQYHCIEMKRKRQYRKIIAYGIHIQGAPYRIIVMVWFTRTKWSYLKIADVLRHS